jgi:spermidine synthase
MAYYGPNSGIGVLLQNYGDRSRGLGGLRVGIVGLGAGTLAAYGLPGDYFRYYEINPDVIALSAGRQPVFTYVRDSQAKVEVEQGDARLLLESEASQAHLQNFDVLVLDAFSGDAVPVHLLTTQAFDTYWKQINPQHGIIAIHVSSRHINLMPAIEGIAEYYNASILTRFTNESYPFLDNLWVFLARRPADLQVRGLLPSPPPLPNNVPPRVWTDDYSDIIRLLY